MNKYGVALTLLLSGIRGIVHAAELQPESVSTEVWKQYEGYSCNWIKLEFRRLEREAKRIAGIQDEEDLPDSTLFIWEWVPSVTPKMSLAANKEKKEKLQVLLGKKEALEKAFHQKKACMSTNPNEFQFSSPFTL